MGTCFSSADKSKDADIKRVQEEVKKLKEYTRTIKMLVYGTGESGKTTLVRQMMMIHGDSLDNDRRQVKGLICYNIIEGAYNIYEAGTMRFDYAFEEEVIPAAKLLADTYITMNDNRSGNKAVISPELREALLTLDASAICQKCLLRRNEFQLMDSWDYFMMRIKNVQNWGDKDWEPNTEDLLRSRIRTLGQYVSKFTMDGTNYQLIDVGGQQNERKKWFEKFNHVDCVLFVVSLSEYDQNLFEDETSNRLLETINFWKQTVNATAYKDKLFVLYFNKYDLFKKKFKEEGKPIELRFKYEPQPPLPQDDDEKCTKAIEWYERLFAEQIQDPEKRMLLKTYTTNALDTESMTKIMRYTTGYLMSKDIGTKPFT